MMQAPSNPDPLLPEMIRGVRRAVRRGSGWLRWHFCHRWMVKRAGWVKLEDGNWRAPDA